MWSSAPLRRPGPGHPVAADVPRRPRLEAEEAAVDPVLAARLLDEAGDPVAVELGHSPLQMWLDHGHRRDLAVGKVKVELGVEVDVGDAVGVGDAETLAVELFAELGDAPAGGRV